MLPVCCDCCISQVSVAYCWVIQSGQLASVPVPLELFSGIFAVLRIRLYDLPVSSSFVHMIVRIFLLVRVIVYA